MSGSEHTLRCNLLKCRAKLSGVAWVTACSHVFCDQHGARDFSRSPPACPACSAALSGKMDVLRTDLTPSEKYKSMVLAGLSPQTVFDISHKALAFWNYQVNQERLIMEYDLARVGGQLVQMEQLMVQQNQSREQEIHVLRGEIATLKKLLEEYKRKHSEVVEQLSEQNREYQKLQGLLDSLRTHTLSSAENDAMSFHFSTAGQMQQRSSRGSPFFLGSDGDRYFSMGAENGKMFF